MLLKTLKKRLYLLNLALSLEFKCVRLGALLSFLYMCTVNANSTPDTCISPRYIVAIQSKNTVCPFMKHSSYFYEMLNFTSIHSYVKRLYLQMCYIVDTAFSYERGQIISPILHHFSKRRGWGGLTINLQCTYCFFTLWSRFAGVLAAQQVFLKSKPVNWRKVLTKFKAELIKISIWFGGEIVDVLQPES